MPQTDDIEQQVIKAAFQVANQAAGEGWTSERQWTSSLVPTLGRVGRELGYYPCGQGCRQHGGQGEWLYDVVWLQIRNDLIVDVPLILESEWLVDYKNISEDFGKLLVGRAAHRVMVFQQKNHDAFENICRKLIGEVRNFGPTQAGDRYLFLGWVEQTFKHQVYVA